MISMIFGRGFYIQAHWGARPETPAAIAARFLRTIDLFRPIDPLFAKWMTGVNKPVDFDTVRDRFEDIVSGNVTQDDYGEPEPIYGYGPFASSSKQPDPLTYSFHVNAGAHLPERESQNYAELTTCRGEIPDPRAITYRIFRPALLALVEAWEPVDCYALPHELLKLIDSDGHFRAVWMQYLSPPLARLVTPPATSVNDYLPNGGLLMSATNETFRVDDPSHIAVARDIAAATAPLNKLPYGHV
jgi:hypothetical protein